MAHGQLARVIRFLRRTSAPTEGAVTDRQLLERFVGRHDQDAFAELARRHGPMVLAVCRRVLPDTHAAEDAFQAAFVVLARKAAAVRWQESVAGWLHEVAFRVAQKARVDAARRRALERQVADVSTSHATAEVDLRELRAVLDEELTRLPDKYRQPLVLCYLEGKTNEEAAQLLGWSKGSVSGELARARDLLRSRLSQRGLSLPAALFVTALTDGAAPAAVPDALWHESLKAATGAVAAPVAALAEGVIQAMFVTKLKMAALMLLAVTVLGAGALTYRTLAGGQTTAVFVPVPEPEAKTMPEAKASDPVVKDGLSVTVKPTKSVFAKDEALAFEVAFKNTSDKAFMLYWGHPYLWYSFTNLADRASWGIFIAGNPFFGPGEPVAIQAGKTHTATITFADFIRFSGVPPAPTQHLSVGKYHLSIKLKLIHHPDRARRFDPHPFWTGELTTKPAEFAVGDKAKADK